MRGTLQRSAMATVAMLVLAWAVLPMGAATAATKKDVGNSDEAWFLRHQEPLASLPTGDVTCELPTGCNASGNAVRRPAPHPEGALVVAANGGDDDAQLFFNFALEDLPLNAVITGGTVTMPVATDPEASNFRAESAQLVACMVTGFIPGGADGGSWQDRPSFDDKTCVPVEVDESAEDLTYTIKLDRFGKQWGTGTPMQGITVLKDPEITPPAPDHSWRVAFNSARRSSQDPEAYPPITSTLEYKTTAGGGLGLGGGGLGDTGGSLDDTGAGGGFDDSAGGGGFESGGAGGFDSGGSFDSGSAPADTGSIGAPMAADAPAVGGGEAPAAEGEQPLAAPGAAADAVPTGAEGPGTSVAVWVMPLLALAMAGALAWSFLQPVQLANEREGAVSKLMRNRRLTASEPSTPA